MNDISVFFKIASLALNTYPSKFFTGKKTQKLCNILLFCFFSVFSSFTLEMNFQLRNKKLLYRVFGGIILWRTIDLLIPAFKQKFSVVSKLLL